MFYFLVVLQNIACLSAAIYLVINGHPWFGLACLLVIDCYKKTTINDKDAANVVK